MSTRMIAHRGGSGLRVENTLAAFANAIDLGADGAELDVHLTRDGEVVVHHDDELNPAYCRRAGSDWIGADEVLPIAELTLAQLRQFDIGAPRPGTAYARKFERIVATPGERVPTLREVIALAKARSDRFELVIEIKSPELDAARKPWRGLADATLAIVDEEGFSDRALLCSFDWGSLIYARERRPRLRTWFTSDPLADLEGAGPPTEDQSASARAAREVRAAYARGNAPWFGGFDPRRYAGGYPEAVAAAGGRAWFPYHRDCTAEVCRELARRGLESAAWSVNLRDEAELARLVRTGVGALVLDYPDVDLRALAARA